MDGLDAPESCQAGGAAARDALSRWVLKQRVTVRVRAFDDYGRSLARVELKGMDMGAVLVLDGHAWSYRWRSDPGPYLAEEWQARLGRKGVFADEGAEEPRSFRRRNGPCHAAGSRSSR
jgi:endonuclease YncB( thermonuclease family)